MKFLLDTNVISELRHPAGDSEVKRRIGGLDPDSLFTSVVVLGELVRGVARLADGTRKHALSEWLQRFRSEFEDRVLPVDSDVAWRWGTLVARCEEQGFRPGTADGQIAATTSLHGMVLTTRNVRHFEPMGVELWNPWNGEF